MNPTRLLSTLLPHLAAALIAIFFCIVNTCPLPFADKLPEVDSLFSALLQGQAVSLPLMLFPVILTFVLPNGSATVKSWFARPNCTPRGLIWLFIMMFLSSTVILTVLSPAEDQAIVAIFKLLQGWQIGVIATFICLIVPFVEELLYRGVMTRGLPTHVALIYSSILFALSHGVNVYLLPLFLTGWMLGIIRLRTGSLFTSIACHAAFNTISLLLATFA